MKRTPLRRVSKKRAKQLREYTDIRKEYLAFHPYCEWWLAENGFTERDVDAHGQVYRDGQFYRVPLSTEIHHKRKRYGSRLNDVSGFMAVSRQGHEAIENNKKTARANGYLA